MPVAAPYFYFDPAAPDFGYSDPDCLLFYSLDCFDFADLFDLFDLCFDPDCFKTCAASLYLPCIIRASLMVVRRFNLFALSAVFKSSRQNQNGMRNHRAVSKAIQSLICSEQNLPWL